MSFNYPVVRLTEAARYIAGRQSGELGIHKRPEEDVEGSTEKGSRAIRSELRAPLDDIRALFEDAKRRSGSSHKEGAEARMSLELYGALKDLPATVLSDSDFWRWIATAELYDLVTWRDGTPGKGPKMQSYGAQATQVNWDCVPFRMFARADIAERVAVAHPTFELPRDAASLGGTDVWRSHIMRVRASYAPIYVGDLLLAVEDGKAPTTVVREVAKRIRRLQANVMLELLPPEVATPAFESELAAASTGVGDRPTAKRPNRKSREN